MRIKALNFKNLLTLVILSFLILTFFSKQYSYFNFDLQLTLLIQSLNSLWFDSLMKFVTFIGNPSTVVILVLVLSIYGFLLGKRKAPLMLIISILGGGLLSQLFKELIGRPRPDPLLVNQIGHLTDYSFPSGHVTTAVALYGFLLFLIYIKLKNTRFRKILMGVCILAIFLMGLSRIYLGAHWFSDVLGALLLGSIWLYLIVLLYSKFKVGLGGKYKVKISKSQ